MNAARGTRGRGLLEGFLARQRARMANALIPDEARAGRIVDIGCGAYPVFLAGTVFREKIGLDRVMAGGGHAELRRQGLDVLHFDVDTDARLPFDDSSADVVTMLAVFEHIAPQRLAPLTRDVRRVLKPGGMLILTTPAHWTAGLLRLLARLRLVSHEEIDEHKDAYSHGEIIPVLTTAGFEENAIRCGSFELGMNLWVTVKKS
ncbi:MAG: class I SAM-dependent methyltransferase [Candidatus Hydrogenedentes bacterium]|nr:class I SAM-dependent methyltransferase [Candidatus Hydrogenedentota bacterium]